MLSPPLEQWLRGQCSFSQEELQEIPGDASFRRYFRLKKGATSLMVMDASLQLDSCEPFVTLAEIFLKQGVLVPEIKAYDLKQGFMLLSDFGDRLYLKELNADNADRLYQAALASLALLQAGRPASGGELPAFDSAFMQRELEEFKCWFLERDLKLSLSAAEERLLQATFDQLTEAASQQTQVLIHRDYHSANLMVLPQTTATGILDFQDACWGPVTYDLVSLLRDCYLAWPEEKVTAWVAYYYRELQARQRLPAISLQQFSRDFDWMGLQRHMKALFIFSRKYIRDHTPRYLQHIPRTLAYILTVSARYPEFQAFHQYARDKILPALARAREGQMACVR